MGHSTELTFEAKWQEYTRDVVKTESSIRGLELDGDILRLTHGIIGIQTEAGELLDSLKKYLFYGKRLDVKNLEEELGDLTYYLALVCLATDLPLGRILGNNIEKLKKRYPDGFSSSDALNRDIENELSHFKDDNNG